MQILSSTNNINEYLKRVTNKTTHRSMKIFTGKSKWLCIFSGRARFLLNWNRESSKVRIGGKCTNHCCSNRHTGIHDKLHTTDVVIRLNGIFQHSGTPSLATRKCSTVESKFVSTIRTFCPHAHLTEMVWDHGAMTRLLVWFLAVPLWGGDPGKVSHTHALLFTWHYKGNESVPIQLTQCWFPGLANSNAKTHIHTTGTTWVSRYQKGKPIWILLKQETVSGSGISWAACKSAPRSRHQITMPAPHHSIFTGQMPFLSPSQQRQSTKGNAKI